MVNRAGHAAGTAMRTAIASGNPVTGLIAGGVSMLGGGNTGIVKPAGLPALPGMPMGAAAGLPATTSAGKIAPQFPTDKGSLDALVAAGIMIPFNKLGIKHYAPNGYVVVHVNGMTIGLRKAEARALHLWKAARKPPMSAGTWHAIQKSHQAVKVLKRMNKMMTSVANFGGHRRLPPKMEVVQTIGKTIVGRKAS